MEYTDLVYVCALNRIFNYNCRLAKTVLEKYPRPETLFSMESDELEELFGRNSDYPARFHDRQLLDDAFREVEWACSKNVKILCYNENGYPRRLMECEDGPVLLFMAGNADLNARRVVSIVGTRKPTSYGMEVCRSILKSLASLDIPPLVVSGLAYGVDICAHREALALGMDTVGVMATGINEIYPSVHRSDAAAMCLHGGIVTDFWRGAPPNKVNFLRRNRIIAGLCDAVVLVESDRDGGGVITSKMAYSYSRDVFAVPGRITDKWSSGCNSLISGKIAESVSSPDRIGELMGWKRKKESGRDGAVPELFPSDSDVKRNIVVLLSGGQEMDSDAICSSLDSGCQGVMSALTELEMEGRIVSGGNGLYRIT